MTDAPRAPAEQDVESAVVLPDRRAVDALRAALARDRELFEPCRAAGAGELPAPGPAGSQLRARPAAGGQPIAPSFANRASERAASHPPGAETEWQRVSGREPFAWETPAPLTGAKRFFFPAREALLRWQVAAGRDAAADPLSEADAAATPTREPALRVDTIEETLPDPAPFVLFGVRPCDLMAIAYHDRFFATDLWYRHRRERALLVGVNCLQACPGGFCRDVDAGPFARTGFDLNLTPLADGRVVVEIGSAAGRAGLASAGLNAASERLGAAPARPVAESAVAPPTAAGRAARGLDPPAAAIDADARAGFVAAAAAAVASFPARPAIARGIARINGERDATCVGDVEWQAFGLSCFACTGCTNLCPTCSCFTVIDERRDGSGERVRYWDSCLLVGFQREASGHHPALRPGDRVRRFWYHKLSRDFVADCGRLGCVGCGRCDVT